MDIINLATEFVKKIMGYVPEKIKNFKEENKIYLEIDAALQELFKKFNAEYHYLEDICEDDLIDNVITDYLKTSSMDMSKTIEGYLSHYTWCKEKKAVVKKFLNDFCLEILAVQKEHLSLENKILVKCIDKVEEDIKNHISLVLGSNITINKIDGVFSNLVHEGRLNQLRKEIEIFDALGQATKQIVSFYKVIAACFYDKSKLITEADNYFEVTDGSYDDRLFKFFIANNERNLLLKYQHKVSSALKFYVETFINENFWGNIIFHNKQDAQNALEITDAFIYEGLFSYFYTSNTPIYCFQLFEDINNPSAIQKIQLLCLKLLFFDYGNIVVTSDRKKEMEKLVSELKGYSSVIDEFDIEYRKKYYSCFLMYEGVNGRFENSYKKLPNEIKNCHEIIELNYIHQIRQGVEISLLEIYNFCVACNSDKLLHIYLNVAKEDGKDIIALLSNNTIILHFSLATFYLYCNELYVKGKYQQCRETLKGITEFSDTIEYLCLKGQLEFVDWNKEFSETVDILKSKIGTEPLTHSAIFAFIEFSVITKSYKIIYEYDWENTTIEIKLFLIDKIIGDKNAAHNDFLVKICSIVINEGYEMPSIYYYRGVANYNLNRYIDATSDLEVSFNLQNYLPAAIALLKAKFSVNDFSYTPAINYCIDVCDQEAQYLVGCYYERLGKEDIAYNCYLRSLLLSPVNNPSIGRLFGLAISDKNTNHPTTVTTGTVCELKSSAGHILNVCIHDRNLKIENMEISDFAGCKHYFEDDEAITELLFCNVNDIIILQHAKTPEIPSKSGVFGGFFYFVLLTCY